MEEIPVIDFGKFDSDPVAVAAAIRKACESIGFLFLKNVGIPQAEIDEMFELVRVSEPTEYKIFFCSLFSDHFQLMCHSTYAGKGIL
jgi:non-haem dioxygenase in morphine synthesis N-terminal